jgi:glycosyltransferase involved in cell wall biosynthesis
VTTAPVTQREAVIRCSVTCGRGAQAAALAYPSLYAGFGMPVLAAIAHGTPVLTSDRSSLPEVAGDAALLVDPTDEAAIAAALVRVVHDEPLRERLAKAAPAQASRFGWPATAAATWVVYREVAR